MDLLISPHGGALCRQLADPEGIERLKKGEACETRAVVLSPRQISDLDLPPNGGFSPLRGFLGRVDYESASDTLRPESGLLGPIPVTFDVPDATVEGLCAADRRVLQDPEGFTHALLIVGDVCAPTSATRPRPSTARSPRASRRALPLQVGPRDLYGRDH